MTGSITPQQTEFLKILSKTGFLTNKHLEQIGFAKTQNSKHYLTKNLLDGGYIGRVLVSHSWGVGRKSLYFLVEKGAKFVSEIYGLPLESLSYSTVKGGIHTAKSGEAVSLIRNDFEHKSAYISVFLAFEKYLQNTNYELTDYRHYYHTKNAKNTLIFVGGKNIRPDGIWWATSSNPSDKDFVFVVEIHRHSERRHILNQLRQQVQAIKEKSVQKRFGFSHPYIVLSVFANENLTAMRGILEELKGDDDWAIIEKCFLFASLGDLQADFYGGLGYFGGSGKPVPSRIE